MWLTFQVPLQNNDTMGRECIFWNTKYEKQKNIGTCIHSISNSLHAAKLLMATTQLHSTVCFGGVNMPERHYTPQKFGLNCEGKLGFSLAKSRLKLSQR